MLQSRGCETPVVEGHEMPACGERDGDDELPPGTKASKSLLEELRWISNVLENLGAKNHICPFRFLRPIIAAEVDGIGRLVTKGAAGFRDIDSLVLHRRRQELAVRLTAAPHVDDLAARAGNEIRHIVPNRPGLE